MFGLIGVLILLGVGLYLITLIPMDPAVLTIIRVVIILCIILFLIQAFGLFDVPVPRFRR